MINNKIKFKKKNNNALRKKSGSVEIDSKLVSFLYQLMRDHVPVGVVEHILNDSDNNSKVLYSNGWLAEYAKYVAERLDCYSKDKK